MLSKLGRTELGSAPQWPARQSPPLAPQCATPPGERSATTLPSQPSDEMEQQPSPYRVIGTSESSSSATGSLCAFGATTNALDSPFPGITPTQPYGRPETARHRDDPRPVNSSGALRQYAHHSQPPSTNPHNPAPAPALSHKQNQPTLPVNSTSGSISIAAAPPPPAGSPPAGANHLGCHAAPCALSRSAKGEYPPPCSLALLRTVRPSIPQNPV